MALHTNEDGLDIPDFLRIPQEQRNAYWTDAHNTTPIEANQPSVGMVMSAKLREAQRAARKAAEDEIAAAAARKPVRAGQPMVLVYRAGRWIFTFPNRLRKKEPHYTPDTLPTHAAESVEAAPVVKKKKIAAKAKPAAKTVKPKSTIETMIEMMKSPEGATLIEMGKATNTKPHSCGAKFAEWRRNGIIINDAEVAGRGKVFRIEE